MISKPMLYAAGAGLLALGLLYGGEKIAHANTKGLLAEEKALRATESKAYAEQTVATAQAASEAVQAANAERDRQAQQAQTLFEAVRRAERERETARRAANDQIRVLEAENDQIRDWADTAYPVDYADWMREPAGS